MYKLIKINFVLLLTLIIIQYNTQIVDFFSNNKVKEKNKIQKLTDNIDKNIKIKDRLCLINEKLIDSTYKDEISYINDVIAYTILSFTKSKEDSLYNITLKKVNGEKKFYYLTQWKNSLEQRNFIADITSLYPHSKYCQKKYNDFSKDTSVFVKKLERYLSSNQISYLPSYAIQKIENEFYNGDIIAFVSSSENKDIVKIGVIKIKDQKPHFYNLDNSAVQLSNISLCKYLINNKNSIIGIMILNVNHK